MRAITSILILAPPQTRGASVKTRIVTAKEASWALLS